MSALPIAFYAPLKATDHPVPSGDRTMARLLCRALSRAGFAPRLESTLRSYASAGHEHAALKAEAEARAADLAAEIAGRPAAERPRLWFTYHVYYKAPDWIGPPVSRALGIPYVVAEGSRAPRRAGGPHALGHAGAEAALDAADLVFVMTAQDRPALERGRPPAQHLVSLPPFVAVGKAEAPAGRRAETVRLLAVAMMRAGDKLASYRLLAETVARLHGSDWSLDIVGDGPERSTVEALFDAQRSRVRFRGRLDGEDLARAYAEADLLVWPAVNEAYGMALLEAQAQGCPVIAGGYGGVRDALREGATGLVTPAGDVDALAAAVTALMEDEGRRHAMAAAARRFAREERSVDGAAERLRIALAPLLERGASPA